MKRLPKSYSREFNGLNTYVRTRFDCDWEKKLLREGTGVELKEDVQNYKTLQEYDLEHGTDYADFFEYFHVLSFWNNEECDWSKELKQTRRRDMFIIWQRIQEPEDSEVDLAHNPTFKLHELGKLKEALKKQERLPKYKPGDYQGVNSLRGGWVKAVIQIIDKKRGLDHLPTSDVTGVTYCTPKRLSQFGHRSNQCMWMATRVTPEKTYREFFIKQTNAEFWIQELNNNLIGKCYDVS